MREAYASYGDTANSTPHDRAVQIRTNVRDKSLTAILMRVAHGVFGRNGITKSLARKTKKAPRTVEYWLSDDRALDLASFHKLVSADVRLLDAFLETIPAAVRETWLREQILAEKLRKADARAEASRREADQLRLELKGR